MSEDLLALLKDLQVKYQIEEGDMEDVANAIETELSEAVNGGAMEGEMPVEGEVPMEGEEQY